MGPGAFDVCFVCAGALLLASLLWLAPSARAAADPAEQKYRALCAGKGLVDGFLTPADIPRLGAGLKIAAGLPGEERYLSSAVFQDAWFISDQIRERTYQSKNTGVSHLFYDADGAEYEYASTLASIQVRLYFFPLVELDYLDSSMDGHAHWDAEYRKLLAPETASGYRSCGPVALPNAGQFAINGVFHKPAAPDRRLGSWNDQDLFGDEYKIYLKRTGSFWLVQLTVTGQSEATLRQRQLLLEQARQQDFARVSNRVVGGTFLTEDLARKIAGLVARKLQ